MIQLWQRMFWKCFILKLNFLYFPMQKSRVGFEILIYVCYRHYELLWCNIYSFICMGFHGKGRG